MTQLFEVRLVRAPKDEVWKTVSDLKQAFLDGDVTVQGSGKGALRVIDLGKTKREEKVAELREKDAIVFEVNDGKAEGRIEIALEEHELGTMIVHRAALDGVGMFGKGRYQKELRKRLDGIQAVVEGTDAPAAPKKEKPAKKPKDKKADKKASKAKGAKKDDQPKTEKKPAKAAGDKKAAPSKTKADEEKPAKAS